MRRTSAVLLAASVAVLAACGDDDPVATGASSTTAPGTASSDDEPPGAAVPGAAEAILRIEVGGGFVPFGTDFAAVPNVVLSDGTVLTGGPITLQYPGPALLPVLTGQLSESARADLLQAARDAHLDEEGRDFGQPGVTDMPTTTITVVLDGAARTTSVYALEAEDLESGLTGPQREARDDVRAFLRTAMEVVTPVATTAYPPVAYQVLAMPAAPAADGAGQEPQPNELDWPGAAPALAGGDCIDVTGGAAEALAAALAEATSITRWRSGGEAWQLAVRATLPGDAPCGTSG